MANHRLSFKPDMIRGIQHEIAAPGTGKSQTRRTSGVPAIEQRPNGNWLVHNRHGAVECLREEDVRKEAAGLMPIQPGDRAWVKEAIERTPDGLTRYVADGVTTAVPWRWKPAKLAAMYMPRELSRFTLYLTDVRVQRLQGISEADAIAEGIEPEEGYWRDYLMPASQICTSPVESYRTLWDSINGAGSWDANPWVVAYTFAPCVGNITVMPQAGAGG